MLIVYIVYIGSSLGLQCVFKTYEVLWMLIVHQSFVSNAPSEPGNRGAFNFSMFKVSKG